MRTTRCLKAGACRAGMLVLGMLWAVSLGSCDTAEIGRVGAALVFEDELDFGPVSIARSRSLRLEIHNQGRTSVSLEAPALEPDSGEFSVASLGEITLEVGEKTQMELRFAPSAVGEALAFLKIPTSSSDHPVLEVKLVGKGVLGRADPGLRRIDFGKVGVMSIASRELPFQNSAANPAEVVLFEPEGPGAENFYSSQTGDFQVDRRSERSVSVHFVPQHIGLFEARLPFRPCPSCDVEEIELVGEGIAAVLVVEPKEVDFGNVTPGSTETQRVTVTNRGTQEIRITGAELGASSSPALELLPFPRDGVVLAEGESVDIELRFTPENLDPQSGTLRIRTNNTHSQLLIVPLKGAGGGPRISAVPNPLLFPRTAVGMQVEKRISIRNVGHDPGGARPLVISEVFISHGVEFSVRDSRGMAPPYELAVGDTRTLVVSYRPQQGGVSEDEVTVVSNDGVHPRLSIPLRGTGVELGPCEYSVQPPELDFHGVSLGGRARLAFGIRNLGSEACALASPRLSSSTSSAFFLETFNSVILEPGDVQLVFVEFRPEGGVSHEGEALVDISSPTDPVVEVPLKGRVLAACLEVIPPHVDFGAVGLACQPPVRPVRVHNSCNVPVEIQDVWLGSGASNSFELLGGTATSLPSGAGISLEVRYSPESEQRDSSPLFLETSVDDSPRLVGLEGTGVLRPSRTDRYEVPLEQMVDVLIVMDNSGSMSDLQDFVSRNFDRFLSSAIARGIDFHIAVTTTGLWPYQGGWARCPGGVEGGEAGRFFPVDGSSPRILSPSTSNLRAAFANNVKVGICHWWEEGLEASRLALSPPLIDNLDAPNHPEAVDGNAGFLRDEAKLVVLYISDEEDDSPHPPQTYIDFLRNLKPGHPELVSASAIVGYPSCGMSPSPGLRYMEVVNALGGLVEDICNPDWGGVLERVGAEAFTPVDLYPLSTRPEGRSVVVSIDGSELPAQAADGTRNWRYEPLSGENGAVSFEAGREPGPGQVVEIWYPVPCE